MQRRRGRGNEVEPCSESGTAQRSDPSRRRDAEAESTIRVPVRSSVDGGRARLRRDGGVVAVRPGDARPLTRDHRPQDRRLDDRARHVRPRLGRPGHRHLDRVGQRHVPRLLPVRRGAQRAVARARDRLPARRARDRPARPPVCCSCSSRVRGRRRAQRADGPGLRGPRIPVGKDVFGALPRVLAAVGSGVGAVVIIVGARVLGGSLRAGSQRARPRAAGRGQRADRARARSCSRAAAWSRASSATTRRSR